MNIVGQFWTCHNGMVPGIMYLSRTTWFRAYSLVLLGTVASTDCWSITS